MHGRRQSRMGRGGVGGFGTPGKGRVAAMWGWTIPITKPDGILLAMHIRAHTHTHIHIYIHIYIHTYMHTLFHYRIRYCARCIRYMSLYFTE